MIVVLLLVIGAWDCGAGVQAIKRAAAGEAWRGGDCDFWATPPGGLFPAVARQISRADCFAEERICEKNATDAGCAVPGCAGRRQAGNSPYQQAKFEAILLGENSMQIAAQNLGQSELSIGAAAR